MSVLEMEPGEPLGLELLKDFLTFMRGFVSIPINLPWTHHGKAIKVINETLRCGNLVKFVRREAIKDVEFRGYHIPAGWKILPLFSSIHLDPSMHENPSKFDPWKWTDPPGSELAKLEAAFFLHHLVLNYRYGKVFKSYIFGCPTIVSCDLELSKFVLQNEGRLFQSSYPKPIRDILGKHSLMLVHAQMHKKLRRIELALINKFQNTPNFLHRIDKLCLSLMESWRGNQLVLFSKQAKQFSFNLMLMNLLDMEPNDSLGLKLLEDFLTFMKGFVSIPINLPWTPYAKAVKARARISSTLNQILKDRKNRNDAEVLNGQEKRDPFDGILVKEDLISDVEKVSILLDLLLAGYETTSGLLSLLIYFLAQSPLALQTLKDEHRALRRKKKEGEPLNWEDYKQMEFTNMVINETLRCGNLVKFVHREAIKDVEFKGYHIPAGWKVLPILSAVHLDPSLHENPSEFNPWRWTDESMSKKVIPFGGGSRLCPGSELGKLEAAFFLHYLLLNYRWTMKEGDYPVLHPYMDFPRGLPIALESETVQF